MVLKCYLFAGVQIYFQNWCDLKYLFQIYCQKKRGLGDPLIRTLYVEHSSRCVHMHYMYVKEGVHVYELI